MSSETPAGASGSTGANLSFGQNYAVLNLDLMSILIDVVKGTSKGQTFISNCRRWNDALHQKDSRPLTIFTSLFFSNGLQPEVGKAGPFKKLIDVFDAFEQGSPAVQISPEFEVDDKDVVLQKTRWYAGAGNALEQILKAQNIDTVIISGLTLSGVVMSTVYRLFDLDYNIFVISDNVLELPVEQTEAVSQVMLDTLLPKMNLKSISIEEALGALDRA